MQYDSHSILVIVGVFTALAMAVGIYAWWLDSLDGSYNPKWTWLTVVGGNALIWFAFAALCAFGVLPWAAALLLAALDFVAGAIIIAWQIGQQRRREHERNDPPVSRNGNGHGSNQGR